MKEIKEIYRKDWDFSLYEVDSKKIITVIFFDTIDYPRSFYLRDSELTFNNDELAKLSEEIRKKYEQYKEREIMPPVFP